MWRWWKLLGIVQLFYGCIKISKIIVPRRKFVLWRCVCCWAFDWELGWIFLNMKALNENFLVDFMGYMFLLFNNWSIIKTLIFGTFVFGSSLCWKSNGTKWGYLWYGNGYMCWWCPLLTKIAHERIQRDLIHRNFVDYKTNDFQFSNWNICNEVFVLRLVAMVEGLKVFHNV